MAKFHGKVGFGETVEASPGVHEEQVVERSYFGDVTRASRTLIDSEDLNKDVTLGYAISIVGDEFAHQRFMNIRYVEWRGVRWLVPTVEPQHPRLLLRLGEVYHGPIAAEAP